MPRTKQNVNDICIISENGDNSIPRLASLESPLKRPNESVHTRPGYPDSCSIAVESLESRRLFVDLHVPDGNVGREGRVARRTNFIRRAALYGVTLFLVSGAPATASSALWLLTGLGQQGWFLALHRTLVAATLLGGFSTFIALFIFHRLFVPGRNAAHSDLSGARVHVGLTAWNDELCMGDAVRGFKACPEVHKVIVVENNSRDGTFDAAVEAGADEVITEMVCGYGSCCMRALAEAAKGADVIILCEGDMTFSARDVKKLLAYLENCDLVLGTRSTQELQDIGTQMDWLLNPLNQLVAKLVQTRFWGTRLTDMGCTYRAIRADAYARLADKLKIRGNHFSPHMFIEALKMNMRVIEVPVVFRQRAGQSKGVGSSKIKAAKVALAMLGLLYRA